MKTLGWQPLPVLVKARLDGSRSNSTSETILRVAAALGGLGALCGVALTCLVGFKAFPPAAPQLNGSAAGLVSHEEKMTPNPPANNPDEISLPKESNQASKMTADNRPARDQASGATSNSTDTPSQTEQAFGTDTEIPAKGTATPVEKIGKLSEYVRENLEKGRRAAERRRARLEEKYRNHAISIEAYRQGEADYRKAIAKYRRGISGDREAQN